MKGVAIDQIVYECMFPKPKATDPQNFQGLLQRQLVPEVRLETQAFYGHLSSQEAKYPGLDYSHQPHRTRLSRYPWHRRLFRAFDNLKLTNSEIAGLTKWEGTRWAKERFEKEQGIVIRDTTSDGIEDWVEPELRVTAQAQRADVEEMEDIQEEDEHEVEENEADDDMDEDSDVELRSVGIPLNEHLLATVAQHEAGNTAAVIDPAWEQWFKDNAEAGTILEALSTHPTGENASHLRDLNMARLRLFQQIPRPLQPLVLQNIEASNRRAEGSTSATTSTSPAPAPAPIPSGRPMWRQNPPRPGAARPRIVNGGEPVATRRLSQLDQQLVASYDNAFAEQYSSRPVPTLASTSTSLGSQIETARGRIPSSGQSQETS